MAEKKPQTVDGRPGFRGEGRGAGMGDPRRMMMMGGIEKAQNIKGTVRRMMGYLGNYTFTILGVVFKSQLKWSLILDVWNHLTYISEKNHHRLISHSIFGFSHNMHSVVT